MNRRFQTVVCCLAALVIPVAAAYESDQYNHRDKSVADSLAVMDARVNAALGDIVAQWRGERDDLLLARRVYYTLGGWFWSDKIERWASYNPAVEKYPQTRYHHIYSGMPAWVSRVGYFFGVGRTMKVNGVMLGTDKFGHFFSQGLKYFKRDRRGWPLERVLARGAFAERWLFGQLTTGVYANADLVANYEGMRFYHSLFAADVVEGKGPIVVWEGNTPRLARDFTWADHVNDYWDEALNPSFVTPAIDRRLKPRIRELCPDEGAPGRFVSGDDGVLWARYAHIGLRDQRDNQFARLCNLAGRTANGLPVVRATPTGSSAGQ